MDIYSQINIFRKKASKSMLHNMVFYQLQTPLENLITFKTILLKFYGSK